MADIRMMGPPPWDEYKGSSGWPWSYAGPRPAKLPRDVMLEGISAVSEPPRIPGREESFAPEYGELLKDLVEGAGGVIAEPIVRTMDAARSGEYNLAPGEKYDPSSPLFATGMGVGAGWPGRGRGPNDLGQISAFHGSPYKFDKFKAEKIGTGEGEQAFGHGLYFTSEKDIAEHYAKNLASTNFEGSVLINGKPYSANEPLSNTLFFALKDGKTKSEIVDIVRNEANIKSKLHTFGKNVEAPILDKLADTIENGTIDITRKPQTYSVTLHKGKQPGEYDYLKWDESINENHVNNILKLIDKEYGSKLPGGLTTDGMKRWLSYYSETHPTPSGSTLYKQLSSQLGSEKEASAFLLRAGIDGIEYPAGSLSGASKKGGKNYVVFDENAITIEK